MSNRWIQFSTLACLLACIACGSSDSRSKAAGTKGPGTCDDAVRFDGACPGVPQGAACEGLACDETCGSRVKVGSSGELAAALAMASAGTCIELGAGSYDAVTLPSDVSLLGDGADTVTVASISVSGGAATTVRGLTVGGIAAEGVGALVVDRVRVANASNRGIDARDSGLTVRRSTVVGSGGFGIAVFCSGSCPAAGVSQTVVEQNTDVGIFARQVDLTLRGVSVSDTGPKDFQRGRGVEVGGGSVDAAQTRVADNADVGVAVFSAGGLLGPDLVVQGNVRGIQLQQVPSTGLTLDGFDVSANKAVGLGVDGASVAIIVQNGELALTEADETAVVGGGRDTVGDGLAWVGGSAVTVDASVTVSGSARAPVVIDASMVGSFSGMLANGDEEVGIIVQNVPSPDSGPTIAPGVATDFKAEPIPIASALNESAGQ